MQIAIIILFFKQARIFIARIFIINIIMAIELRKHTDKILIH